MSLSDLFFNAHSIEREHIHNRIIKKNKIMTHILSIEFPQESFILVKKPINVHDRLIFQNDTQPETEVTVIDVKDQPGLMKGWKIVSWNANGKAE